MIRDGRRGRGATGKSPFIAAVSTNEDGHPIHTPALGFVDDIDKFSGAYFGQYLLENKMDAAGKEKFNIEIVND